MAIDRVIENQKAAMPEPYLSMRARGALMFDHEAMKKMVLGGYTAEGGYSITVHAIGDRAVRKEFDI